MTPATNIAGLLKDLMRIPSVTANHNACREVLDHVTKLFDTLPVSVNNHHSGDHASFVAGYKGDREFDVILQAHLDVVDAPAECFDPKEDEENIYGRGAYDMKGPAASLISAFIKHVESDSPLSVGLMLTTDEETGGQHGVHYLLKEEGYRARCCILPDGGENFQLVVSQKGIVWSRIALKGKSAHSSRPADGENAILSFMERYNELARRIARIPETSISLSNITGSGQAFNVVPDMCEAGIDIRSPEPDRVLEVLHDLFQPEELEILEHEAGFTADPTHPILKEFTTCMEEVLQRPVVHHKESGASDARFFSIYDIPTVVCGLVGGNLHQDDEWVNRQSLTDFEQMILLFFGKAEKMFLRRQMEQEAVS